MTSNRCPKYVKITYGSDVHLTSKTRLNSIKGRSRREVHANHRSLKQPTSRTKIAGVNCSVSSGTIGPRPIRLHESPHTPYWCLVNQKPYYQKLNKRMQSTSFVWNNTPISDARFQLTSWWSETRSLWRKKKPKKNRESWKFLRVAIPESNESFGLHDHCQMWKDWPRNNEEFFILQDIC